MAAFDFTPFLAPDLPPPAAKYNGFPRFNFIGGHNDPAQIPVDALMAAANAVLRREGRTLATYGMESGPLGYRPLREFLAAKMKRHAGITCSPDDILVTNGSLQGLDLVNGILLAPGDTVLIERDTYGGALTRLNRLKVKTVGVPLDKEGLSPEALDQALADLAAKGVKPKYIYTIPTVQNPTGAIMSEARRAAILKIAEAHGVPIFEDECYSDLVWTGARPPAFYAMTRTDNVIHIGSFSKSIAPAFRIGYIVARPDLLSRMQALKTDGGSGALDQMVLAEFCQGHFHDHVPKLSKALRGKLETLMESLSERFGTAAEFDDPPGGIFLWIKLPDVVDTVKLGQVALAEGVALNPGPEWSTDKARAKCRLRLCFANPDHDTIRAGVAKLAEICQREFGVPLRSANIEAARS
jgi:2-aminoadipate transaminase